MLNSHVDVEDLGVLVVKVLQRGRVLDIVLDETAPLWCGVVGVVWCGGCGVVGVVGVVWCGGCGVVWSGRCGGCGVVWCGGCGMV